MSSFRGGERMFESWKNAQTHRRPGDDLCVHVEAAEVRIINRA